MLEAFKKKNEIKPNLRVDLPGQGLEPPVPQNPKYKEPVVHQDPIVLLNTELINLRSSLNNDITILANEINRISEQMDLLSQKEHYNIIVKAESIEKKK